MKKPIMPLSGPVNMKQVAELAGVAVSTVSRALANPDRVNDKTRKRIEAAARKLGYTPNAAARSLRIGRSNVVMIILPGQLFYGASQVIPQVLAGIDVTLSERGYNLLIGNLDRREAAEKHIIDLGLGGSVDGAIIISSNVPSVGGRSLSDGGLPLVSVLHDIGAAGVPSVVTNERPIMAEVTAHLIAEGHRDFFYISGPRYAFHEIIRPEGIRDAMAAQGLSPADLVISAGDRDYQEGFQIGRDAAALYLAMPRRPTAVLSCSDDAALSFMHAIREAGVAVPQGTAVIGFDGSAVGALVSPALSTIAQPAEAMGRKAAELLLDRIDGQEVAMTHVLDSHFLRRQSG